MTISHEGGIESFRRIADVSDETQEQHDLNDRVKDEYDCLARQIDGLPRNIYFGLRLVLGLSEKEALHRIHNELGIAVVPEHLLG